MVNGKKEGNDEKNKEQVKKNKEKFKKKKLTTIFIICKNGN